MKKLLVFVVILTSLIFGVQGFSQMNSKEFEKVMAKVAKEYDTGNKQRALSMLKEDIQNKPKNRLVTNKKGIHHYGSKNHNRKLRELQEWRIAIGS